jgi:hypothetical protein
VPLAEGMGVKHKPVRAATMELNTIILRTALKHFVENSPLVEAGQDKYAFVDDLHFTLERYFEEQETNITISDPHELHKALEMEGYTILYSGVLQSYVNDPERSGLVVRGFSVQVPEIPEEEDDEDEEEYDEDDEDEDEDDEDEDEYDEDDEDDEDEEEYDEDENEDEDDEDVEEEEEAEAEAEEEAEAV